jgi:hypothetical protein
MNKVAPLRVSPEAWADWKLHPVTKEVQEWAARWRSDVRREWELGAFTHQDAQTSAMLNARALGMCAVLEAIESLELTSFGEEDGE